MRLFLWFSNTVFKSEKSRFSSVFRPIIRSISFCQESVSPLGPISWTPPTNVRLVFSRTSTTSCISLWPCMVGPSTWERIQSRQFVNCVLHSIVSVASLAFLMENPAKVWWLMTTAAVVTTRYLPKCATYQTLTWYTWLTMWMWPRHHLWLC